MAVKSMTGRGWVDGWQSGRGGRGRSGSVGWGTLKGGGLQGVVGFVFRMFIAVIGIALMISSTYYNIKGLM
jgi:hypothetical protein